MTGSRPCGPIVRGPTLRLAMGIGFALVVGTLCGYLLASWGPIIGLPLPPGLPTETVRSKPAEQPTSGADFIVLGEIRDLIEGEYYRPANADRQKLLYGAARGMVQSLGDPNSVYEPPTERELGDSRWTGRYDGVGIFVDQRDGLLVVTAPVEGGPAARAGIRPGDTVLEADGRALAGLALTDQTVLIRGPKGTPVTLTIRREGQGETLKIIVVREEIRLISARGRILDNGFGLLRITQFTEGTVDEARTALEGVLASRPGALILDLRSNGGGLLEPAVKVAGYFLGGGPVVLEAHADGEQRTYAAPEGSPLTDLPMVVLIDRGTASASEVMAAALRDRGRAELIGDRTYGKNTVQYIHRLSDGSGLRITVAEWHTPSGQPIPPTGLMPDLAIISPAQPTSGDDAVLDAASERLRAALALAGRGPSTTDP